MAFLNWRYEALPGFHVSTTADQALPRAQSKKMILTRQQSEIALHFLLTNHNQIVMVLCVMPGNANHEFSVLADPSRRSSSGWGRWQGNELHSNQNLTAQSGKDESCKSS